MSRSYLNLARQPYVNTRPVVRLSIVLWLIGAVLFAGNVWLYWDFLAGRGDTHKRLAEVATEIDQTRGRIAALDSELAGFDLADQNDRVDFLNTRIERRHFSWSHLFDALSGLLPDDVRLTRLTPSSLDDGPSSRRRSARTSTDDDKGVSLTIQAVAKTNDSILTLVQRLFEDPAFAATSLIQQRLGQGGLIEFDIDTTYDPGRPERAAAAAAAREGVQAAPAEDAGAAAGLSAEERRPTRLGPAASSAPEVVR